MNDAPKGGKKKFLLGGIGILVFLAAWITFSANAPLPPIKHSSKAVEAKVDWKAVEAECTLYLQELLGIPSINPPGNEEPVARVLERILAKEQIPHKVIRSAPGRALVYARLEGQSPKKQGLCLANHIDVVPAFPSAWDDPDLPFSGKLIDGRIYGRGALDMKGFVVMQLMTMILVKRLKIPLQRDLVFLALPDEEAGGKVGADWVVKNRKDLLEGLSCMWNEGGMGVKKMPGLDRPIFGLMHAERGALWLELSAKGPGGHGSSAPPGNAPERLFEGVRRILAQREGMTTHPITNRMFSQMSEASSFPKSFFLRRVSHPLIKPLLAGTFEKERFLAAVTRNTRNLTVWDMGSKVNVVPPRALAKIDIRLLPGVDPKAYLQGIEALVADLNLEIRPLTMRASSESPIDDPLFDIIRSTVERLRPGSMAVPLLSPGGTDSASFRPLGLHCYGLIPALFTREEMKGFHGANEHMRVDALVQGTRATFEASVNYCQLKVTK